MTNNQLIYSGKAKSLFRTDKDDILRVEFRDDTSAFDGEKMQELNDKGAVNNQINAFIMQYLKNKGIPCHFEKILSANESLVKRLDMIPIECVVRNISCGSLCRRLSVPTGMELDPALFELFYKSDELHDPIINRDHARAFGWANSKQLDQMQELSLKINKLLTDLFKNAKMILVDAKYEFGMYKGEVVLGDEISPDSCRIWDADTRETLDKDRFRKDMGDVVESYKIIAARLGVDLLESDVAKVDS